METVVAAYKLLAQAVIRKHGPTMFSEGCRCGHEGDWELHLADKLAEAGVIRGES